IQDPTSSTLFPYTTLFRSEGQTDCLREGPSGERNAHRADLLGRQALGATSRAAPVPTLTSLGSDYMESRTGTAPPPSATLPGFQDRKSTRLNSSHLGISYA